MFDNNRPYYPWVTNILVFINLSAFIWVQRETLPSLSTDWLAFGAVEPVHVWSGEIWRLITAQFMHAGLIHFVLNTVALYQIGKLVEMFLGSLAVGMIFLSSGIAGFCCSLIMHPGPVALGASASIFGLLGALLGLFVVMPKRLPHRALLRPLAILVVLNFLLGEMFNHWTTAPFLIDNAAHAGGFVLGLLWAFALAPQYYLSSFVTAPALVVTISALCGVSMAAVRPDFHTDYFLFMGQQALTQGQLSAAKQYAYRLIQKQPDSWQAHVLLARVAATRRQHDETRLQLQQALQQYPTHNRIDLWHDAFNFWQRHASPLQALFADEPGNAALCQFALQPPSVAATTKQMLDRCAWLSLMTHDPNIHNPSQALVWSKQATDIAGESASLMLLRTLAEAYKQTGDLKESRSVLQWALLQTQPTQETLAQQLLQQERYITRQLRKTTPPTPLLPALPGSH